MKLDLEPTDLVGAAAAIDAAGRAGLFQALLDGDGSSEEALRERLGVHPRGLAVVLDVLVAVGLVARDEDGFLRPAPALAAVDRRMPGAVALAGALFAGAPELLRSGAPVVVMDGDPAQRAEAYRRSVGGLAGLFQRAAEAFAEALGPVAGGVLDVGCGSGVWSLAVAARNPSTRVTGLDLEGVTDVFLEHCREAGLAGRARAWTGSAHTYAFPDDAFELALIANVLRLEPEAQAAALVRRVAQAVRPGGRLVVLDALSSGTPEREVSRAVYGLHLALRTTAGAVHPPSKVRGWLAAAGLTSIEALDFGVHPGAVAALVGHRPL
ncbi:MAG: class I SAM-dependent methyltransferase [Deltaproteobacteria bacterium]|nr:class I SAM-dependent methyltransferase [Deltaproteobacteria bacterium]